MFALIAAASVGVTLWQDIRAGMTFQQVKAIHPAARAITPDIAGQYVINCTHVDADVEIYGIRYSVCYTIKAAGVQEVTLYANKKYISPLAGIKSDLVGKYGTPLLDECKPSSTGTDCELVLRKNGVKLRATDVLFDLTNEHTTSIHYTPEGGDLPL